MRRNTVAVRQWSAAGLALLLTFVATAQAVVISSTNTKVNLVAPANDPGWNNVAHLSNASAVYLGNRWMITVDHVADAPVRFSDGRVIGIATGSDVRFHNPGSVQFSVPDLRMFRLDVDPGLPALPIDTSTPPANAAVMMIGAGRDRSPDLLSWRNTTPVWTPIALPVSNRTGFSLLDTRHMAWGTNQVLSGGLTFANGNTLTFSTQFDSLPNPYEAQAETGDSGGAVFRLEGSSWKLVGLMAYVQGLDGQPSNTTAYGDQTLSIDLASYRDQIEAVLNHADPAWQNHANRFDVDHSGLVSPLDAMRVMNELQAHGRRTLAGAPAASDPFFDVNGDGAVGPLDLLQLINALIADTANPSIKAQSALAVAEPSGGVLAALGMLAIALARGIAMVRRRRRAH